MRGASAAEAGSSVRPRHSGVSGCTGVYIRRFSFNQLTEGRGTPYQSRALAAHFILPSPAGTHQQVPIQSLKALRHQKQVRASYPAAVTFVVRSLRPIYPPLTRPYPASPQGVPYSELSVGVPLEIYPDERRVALTPQNAALLLKKGFGSVLVEKSAGLEAQFLDEQYRAAGATLVEKSELLARSDILLKVRPPELGKETDGLKEGSTLISFLYPGQNKPIVDAIAERKATAFAMEMIPRISRAQVFDALRFVIDSTAILAHTIEPGLDNAVPWPTLPDIKRF